MFAVEVSKVHKDIFSFEELGKDISKEHVIYAEEVFDFEQDQGFPKDPIISVDNKFNKKIEDVKPFGKIELINSQIDLVEDLMKAYDILYNQSKVKSGRYREHHWVYINNMNDPVAKNRFELLRWAVAQSKQGFPRGLKISFVNVTPYARKLEQRGIKKGSITPTRKKRKKRGIMISAPNGTYQTAQRTMKRILKGRAYVGSVKFKARVVPSVDGLATHFSKIKTLIGKPYFYPQIDITPIAGKGVIQ